MRERFAGAPPSASFLSEGATQDLPAAYVDQLEQLKGRIPDFLYENMARKIDGTDPDDPPLSGDLGDATAAQSHHTEQNSNAIAMT
ncbi:unnamed protein product, partial [Amoebophrya sp. A25]|eukprot:GSA25T00009464001.1